jgi:hypothetical protein
MKLLVLCFWLYNNLWTLIAIWFVCFDFEALRFKLEVRGVRFPMVALKFFIDPYVRTMALVSTQPLTAMSARNISLGVKTAGT